MDDPAVDAETVRHVASLAHVEIDEDEVERYAQQFEELLAWFEGLDSVPETAAEDELTNVLRADTVRPGLDREAALSNADDHEDGYFRGPPVG